MRENKYRVYIFHPESNSGYFEYFNALVGMGKAIDDIDPLCVVHEPEQYTGIKDKNDKDIYEGDIFLSTYRAGSAGTEKGKRKERIRQQVVWDNRGHWGRSRLEEGRGYGICYPESNLGEDVEVIGNIHENSNLLE